MTKQAKRSQRVKSRHKRARKAKAESDNEPSVVGSRSYIVSRNSLPAKCLKGNENENEEGFPEGCAITRDDFRSIMGSRFSNTPLPSIGVDMKFGNRICTPTDKPGKHESFLPDINSHLPGKSNKRPEDHVVDVDMFDVEMYDVECIRKTRSGIAFTQFLSRPYRLPRLHSEGEIKRRPQPRVNEFASFVTIKQPRLNRSGGTFVENLRSDIEENRQAREQRNIERMQRQIQEVEGRVSRLAGTRDRSCDEVRHRSYDSNEERVHAIVQEQENIRRVSFEDHVRRFMDKRK